MNALIDEYRRFYPSFPESRSPLKPAPAGLVRSGRYGGGMLRIMGIIVVAVITAFLIFDAFHPDTFRKRRAANIQVLPEEAPGHPGLQATFPVYPEQIGNRNGYFAGNLYVFGSIP